MHIFKKLSNILSNYFHIAIVFIGPTLNHIFKSLKAQFIQYSVADIPCDLLLYGFITAHCAATPVQAPAVKIMIILWIDFYLKGSCDVVSHFF